MISLPTVDQLDAMILLTRLVECDRLSDAEARAFRDMRYKLGQHGRVLSKAQREWAETVYQRLELDAEQGAINVVSSGLVPGDPGGTQAVLDTVLRGLPDKFRKPLRPPVPR